MSSSGDRTSGILIPAFSARRKGDLGIGDTLALREWIDWAADHRVGFLQLLPVNENGVEESPYSAISSIALDPIYLALDPEETPFLTPADLDKAREKLSSAIASASVDYPAVRREKRTLLELAWSRFEEAGTALREEFEAFQAAEASWLDDYTLFRWLMERYGEHLTWDDWPAVCNTPEKARAFLAGERLKSPGPGYRLGFHAFVQWLCFRQWRAVRRHAGARGVKLMGDIPIGVSWHSCDVFFNQDDFHLNWFGGSPPEGHHDRFFQEWGQNWGIPLYRWQHMEIEGYPWWKQRVARHTEIFNIFRLDHILGFYRIYAFPWHPRRNGEFIGLNHEQAAAINEGRLPRWFLRSDDTEEDRAANRADGDPRLRAIVEAAGENEIIAEDLGWVPGYVRPHLEELGIAGFRIPHWDCEYDHPVPGHRFPEPSFAVWSTHDHDPVCAIWKKCRDTIEQHRQQPSAETEAAADGAAHMLRLLSEFAGIPLPHDGRWLPFTEGVHWRLVKSLYSSRSRYASLAVTELFNLDDRINHPGTSGPLNWTFRLPWTMEEIRADRKLSEISTKLATIIGVTRRG